MQWQGTRLQSHRLGPSDPHPTPQWCAEQQQRGHKPGTCGGGTPCPRVEAMAWREVQTSYSFGCVYIKRTNQYITLQNKPEPVQTSPESFAEAEPVQHEITPERTHKWEVKNHSPAPPPPQLLYFLIKLLVNSKCIGLQKKPQTYLVFPRFARGPRFQTHRSSELFWPVPEKNWAVRAESVRMIHNYVSGTRTTNFTENFKDSAQKLHLLSTHLFPSPLLLQCQKLNMPHLPVSWRMKNKTNHSTNQEARASVSLV